jgi:hypothetical protein
MDPSGIERDSVDLPRNAQVRSSNLLSGSTCLVEGVDEALLFHAAAPFLSISVTMGSLSRLPTDSIGNGVCPLCPVATDV